MKLVWHHPAMRQKEWIRFIFGSVVTEEIDDPNFDCFEDDAIHVVSMIYRPLREMDAYFAQCRKVCKNIVLYHAGDEWFSGGCAPYKHFDNVVREMPSFFTKGAGITCVPLGNPVGSPPRWKKRSSQRELTWSFAGEIRNTRIEMIEAFAKVPDGKIIDTNSGPALTPGEYQNLLNESVFAPSAMGNIITETWRVYEAIDAGAIPLIERRLTLDYYKELLGNHPIPTFSNWQHAAAFANRLAHDEQAIDNLQQEIFDWWTEYKATLVERITRALSVSHHTELVAFGRQPANTNIFLHETLRVVELLRHQSAHNIKRRFANPIAPVRRIALGLLKKDER